MPRRGERARHNRPPAGRSQCRVSARPGQALASLLLAASLVAGGPGWAQDVETVRIGYIKQAGEALPKLSNLELPPPDEGIRGAELAVEDNNTTGRFLGQRFELQSVIVPPAGDPAGAFKGLIDDNYRFFVLDVPARALLAMADLPEAKDLLLFNAGAADDSLRNEDCRRNVLHTVPSRAMKADALAQYLIWKKWPRWFLVVGRRPGDAAFAAAVERSAKRFGGEIVARKAWTFGPDTRRTAQSLVPVFTQGLDYDVLIVADEVGEFGEYLMYRTWEPKVVAGTQGLVPTAWHRAHEQWGAVQLQNRFHEAFGRWMTATDQAAWQAVRAIGEAATRAGSTEFERMAAYIRSDEFELAAFKGQKLTFRKWNNQLRQPVLLAWATSLVSVSPQEGFLHPKSLLDTLGYDQPESSCRLNG